VEHRNHMSVLSPNRVSLAGNTLEWDFRIQNSYTPMSAGFSQKQILPGVYAMYTGDIDKVSDVFSSDINGLDLLVLLTQNGLYNEYLQADLNFDGQVNGADKVIWSFNNGYSNRVVKVYD